MFQNSQIVSSDSSINDAAESSWNEMQNAFGTSTGGGADVSVPVQFLSVDAGGKMQHIQMDSSATGKKDQSFSKTEEK